MQTDSPSQLPLQERRDRAEDRAFYKALEKAGLIRNWRWLWARDRRYRARHQHEDLPDDLPAPPAAEMVHDPIQWFWTEDAMRQQTLCPYVAWLYESKGDIREAARHLGVGKSTAHRWLTEDPARRPH